MLAGMLFSIGFVQTASAHPHEPAEADDETGATEAAGAAENAPEATSRLGETKGLRFADRRQVLFRLGFGGRYEDAIFGKSDASPTFGATLRWDRPVHEYVTTGLGFSFYTAKATAERFYEPAFDIDFHIKGRFPFQMGRKERKFEAEAYLLAQVGLTIWIDSNSLFADFIGPGWNIGLTPGFLFFINSRIGLLAELGWMRTQAFFANGRLSILLNQGVFRVGPVFPF